MSSQLNELTDREALQNFLLDTECLNELLPWTGNFNIFDILKISRAEIRHSNMLGWLLNPNENHGLGDAFLKGLLQRLVENDSDGRYDVFGVLLMDMYTFTIYREWKNIDILLISDKEQTLIAIENKVGSREHSDQLNRYRNILESEYPNHRKIYVFLTPDGEDPSDVENWDVFTYSDVVDNLERLCSRTELQPDVNLMIENYIDVVRRDVMKDQQLIDVCNKIYNKHKKALDLIFDNRIDETMQVSESVRSVLQELSASGRILFSEDESSGTYFVFHTKRMDGYLNPLDKARSSWNTTHLYNYWLRLRDNRLYGIFELGGWNVPEPEMERMQRIIGIVKPADKRSDDFKYKRIFRTKWYDIKESDTLEDDIRILVEAAVDELMQKEDQLLQTLIP